MFIFVLLFQSIVFATNDTKQIDWFFKSANNNTRPKILNGNNSIDNYNALYIGNTGDKTIYLTFDAGYCNENLEKILDILKEHEVTAAFFILPGIIKNNPDTVKRMKNENHLVCNHSTTHKNMAKIQNIDEFKTELNGVEELCKEQLGFELDKYFRPPQGAFSLKTLEFCNELGYTPVFWSFAYDDWDNNRQMNYEKAKNKAISNIYDGAVFLLHPTSKTNAEILSDVITEAKSRGYSFGSLDQLKSSVAQ